MTEILKLFSAAALLLTIPAALSAQDTFKVRIDQPQHGKVTVLPELPKDGVVKAGRTRLIRI